MQRDAAQRQRLRAERLGGGRDDHLEIGGGRHDHAALHAMVGQVWEGGEIDRTLPHAHAGGVRLDDPVTEQWMVRSSRRTLGAGRCPAWRVTQWRSR